MPSSNAILIDTDTAEGKLQKAAVKRNKIAMAYFTMAFASEGTTSLIYQAETQAWPNGLASLVTDALEARQRLRQRDATKWVWRSMLPLQANRTQGT
jgi:hypothetical protein